MEKKYWLEISSHQYVDDHSIRNFISLLIKHDRSLFMTFQKTFTPLPTPPQGILKKNQVIYPRLTRVIFLL